MTNVSSVENINLNVTGAVTIDTAGANYIQNLTAISNNTLAINNLGSLPVVNLSSTNATTLNILNSALAGTNNLTVNLQGGQTGNITITDTAGSNTLETITLNATSTNTVGTLTASGLGATTLNIGGTGQLTVTTLTDAQATIRTINGAANSGGFSITALNGGSTVIGGSGADSITAGTGNDSIFGGAGNDTLTFAAGTLTTNDTVDGGEGVNTIVLAIADAATTTPLTRVTNVQTLQISDAITAQTITTANIATSINRVNIAVQGAGGNAAINFGAGANTLGLNIADALNGNQTLTIDAAGSGTTDSLTIVNMLAANSALAATSDLTITDFEAVTFNTGTALSTTQLADVINAGSAAFSITGVNSLNTAGTFTAASIDASGLTGTAALIMDVAAASISSITGSTNADVLRGDASSSIAGGAGNDSIFGGTGNDTLRGEAGNDTITGSTGNDLIDGGSGNDTVQFATTELTVDDTVDGGEGALDVLSYTTYANADNTAAAMSRVSNFEVIQVAGVAEAPSTLTMSNFGSNAGFVRVNIGDLTSANAGARTIAIANASSLLNQMNIVAAQTAASTITFARLSDTDTDTLTISNARTGAGGGATFAAITASNEETINISGSIAANTITATAMTAADLVTLNITGAAAISLAAGAGIVDATLLTTINASAATGAVTVNATNSGVNMTVTAGSGNTTITTGSGRDSITGGNGDDVFVAGAGNDTISGGAGADSITGGTGADLMTGGSGADRFIYTAAGQGGNTTTVVSGSLMSVGDTVADFTSGTDRVNVTAVTAFDGVAAANTWTLSATAGVFIDTNTTLDFIAGETTAAQVSAAIGTVGKAGGGGVVVTAGDIGYAALLDNQGTASTADDVYNVFEITFAAANDAAVTVGITSVSLVATLNTSTLVVGDFINAA